MKLLLLLVLTITACGPDDYTPDTLPENCLNALLTSESTETTAMCDTPESLLHK